jgi:FAD/FMN-containing dehydrogenase
MAGAGRFEIAPFSIVHAGGTLNLQQMHGIRAVSGTQITRVRPGATVRTLAKILARAKPTLPFPPSLAWRRPALPRCAYGNGKRLEYS